MTTDDRDVRAHDVRAHADLESYTRDATAHLDRLVAAAHPVPDFAAVMSRARALEDAPIAPVIPLSRAVEGAAGADAGLAPFTAALREEFDEKLHKRSLLRIPGPVSAPRRRRRGVVIGLLAAAAALLFLAVAPEFARPGERREQPVEANASATLEPQGGAANSLPVKHDERTSVATTLTSPTPPSTELESAVLEDSQMGPPPPPSIAPSAPADGPRRRKPAADPSEPSLEDEAQAMWQRGELAAAEQKLREVLTIAGKGRRAELAYGDLFVLTRQMHGPDAQLAVWREYLEQFPRGQFADDARAGLCQRAPVDGRAACWQDYLAQHPEGAHRKQAEAAQGRGGATP